MCIFGHRRQNSGRVEVFFCSDRVSEQVPLAVVKQTEDMVILQRSWRKRELELQAQKNWSGWKFYIPMV